MKGRSIQVHADGVASLIDTIGKNCKITQVLREGIVNGIEANSRASSGRGTVVVMRDWEHENKISIVNYDGEFLSETVADENLATLGSSGNKKHSPDSDNFGIGAKVSYLPKASQGILYRSVSACGDSNKFQIMKVNNCEYGVKEFVSEQDCYIETECGNIPDGKFGTEMVLMGNYTSENTWKNMCDKVSSTNVKFGTGSSLSSFILERFWKDMGSDIYVQKYSQDNVKGSKEKIVSLKEEMASDDYDLKGCVSFFGEDGVPDGTKAYYVCTKTKKKNHGTGLRGIKDKSDSWGTYFISFACGNENYRDYKYSDSDKILKENVNSHTKKARACGLYVEQRAFVIVFELPESFNAGVSQDRMRLTNVDSSFFFEAFRNNMPEEIEDYLSNNTETISEDLTEEMKKLFSSYKNPPKVLVSGGSHIGGTNPGTRTGNGSSKERKRKAIVRLKSFDVPDMINSLDKDSELVSFNFRDYKLIYNYMHPVCQDRTKRVMDEEIGASKELIDHEIRRMILMSSIEIIFEIQRIYESKSIQDKEDLWSSDVLSSIWNPPSHKEVLKRVRIGMKKFKAKQ